MAAPQLLEAQIKVSDQVLLTFDQALDTEVEIPLTAFSLNYGRVPLVSWKYYGTAGIALKVGRTLTSKDKIEVNYQPPEDINKALRAPIPRDANAVVIRRNVVRAFYKVPCLNQVKPNESGWNEMSNLGPSDDQFVGEDSPEGNPWQGGCNDLNGNQNSAHSGSTSARAVRGMRRDRTGKLVGGTDGSHAAAGGYYNYPISTRPNPRTATPDDFVLAYGLKEAIQLSNIDDADAIQPNTDKIWMAIQDASALIDNYIVQASRGGQLIISSNRRRTALVIARYYLDTIRRREDVKEDYEKAITYIERAMSMESVVRPDQPWWQDPCNPRRGCGVRSHRIPQYYNGVSGKGLSGWWSDTGAVERNDWRYMRLNSEVNNNEGNHRDSTNRDDAPFSPVQPADDGGIDYGNPGPNSP